jgi:SAM-dependent methyltransferase
VTLEDWKAERSRVWGSAPFERIAWQLTPLHDHLIERLRPRAGERWLDVATGTGAIAFRAARAGADVTGLDFASPLVETARRLAAGEGLAVRFDVGDVERLPYDDASFDVVSSAVGAVFAPDHRAVARELGRVTRPAGRIGIVAWRPGSELSLLVDEFRPPAPDGAGNADDWGREEYAETLLGDAFELEFDNGDCPLVGESGEAIWELVTTSVGPMKDVVARLDPRRLEELHRLEVDLLERHRATGGVRYPQPYLLVLGTRRP